MPLLTDSARAKVNLTLRVLGRRADSYHDIDSVVAFADCADGLTLEPGDDLKLTTSGPRATECGDGDDNLVLRVSRALAEKIPGLKLGHFALDKHLPVAAGIGGGSADAAAALRLLAKLNGLDLNDPRVIGVARATGADIPVCLASRACVMTGVGENLAMLDLPRLPCVMVNPRIAVATKDVFNALGLSKGSLRAGAGDIVLSPNWPAVDASVADWLKALGASDNDLEAPALKVEPAIADVLAELRACAGSLFVRMSGSGATCFAIFGHDEEARAAGATLTAAHPGWWVHGGALS